MDPALWLCGNGASVFAPQHNIEAHSACMYKQTWSNTRWGVRYREHLSWDLMLTPCLSGIQQNQVGCIQFTAKKISQIFIRNWFWGRNIFSSVRVRLWVAAIYSHSKFPVPCRLFNTDRSLCYPRQVSVGAHKKTSIGPSRCQVCIVRLSKISKTHRLGSCLN